jgi:hypothetical protein
MNTALNTALNALTARTQALACIAAPLLCAALVTFTGVQVIASYALPEQAAAGAVLAAASAPAAATVNLADAR